jgi:hypothetical protein
VKSLRRRLASIFRPAEKHPRAALRINAEVRRNPDREVTRV